MITRPSKILLIYTGGTIGMVKDTQTGSLVPLDFDQLIDRIPELTLLDCAIETISFERPIDSSNMSPAYWVDIATIIEMNYHLYDGFVVLHGSDTMSYTASAMSFMLENLSKPVVFTGSQLPIGDLRTDAKENLITSIQIAALSEGDRPLLQEVGLYFEYKLYRANRTTKINAEHFEAFASFNFPPLIESGVHLKINKDDFWPPSTSSVLSVHKNLCTDVALIKLYPGISHEFLRAVFQVQNLKAVVLETFGAGNTTTENLFLKSLEAATRQGIHLINVTQCSGGSVIMGHYETSIGLQRMGVISGKDMTTESALAKSMVLLGAGYTGKQFKTLFETSLRGERS